MLFRLHSANCQRPRVTTCVITWYAAILTAIGLVIASAASPALGQFEGFQISPELSRFNTGPPDPQLNWSAQVRMEPGASIGLLEVTATMDPSWHVYSLTQPSGGPLKTHIKLEPSDQYRLLGSFAPDHPPKLHYVDVFKMNAEEFSERVTWSVPIEVNDAANLKISGFAEGQVCADGGACVPFDDQESAFEATVQGELTEAQTAALTGVQLPNTHSPIRTWLSRDTVKPGDSVNLLVAFDPEADWHVYAYEQKKSSPFLQPTLIHSSLPDGWSSRPATSAAAIISKKSPVGDDPTRYYDGAATIAVPIEIPKDAKPGEYPLSGRVAFQTCANACDFPTAIAWKSQLAVSADVKKTDPASIGVASFEGKPLKYEMVAQLVESAPASQGASSESNDSSHGVVASNSDSGNGGTPLDNANQGGNATGSDASNANTTADSVASSATASQSATGEGQGFTGLSDLEFDATTDVSSMPLLRVLGLAFVGGFILNFMPCVLPVIGLKVLSFVDQAGSDRVKVFNLNLVYALGMLTVFWILAAFAAAPLLGLSEKGLGWGQQFNYQGFAIPLVCVVFVMALSFLGVWEIPIPGFATSGAATELTEKEGLSGAFFKGIITTVLATPCSAPGLGAAYAFAVNSKSIPMAFLIFTVLGLGMAVPYLLIGAFPSLIRFLPKPGAWMDTFKQLMGFVLLGTVIFLMQNVSLANLLPTIALLFGLWFACWWIGSVPLTAEPGKRWRAWGVSLVIGLISVVIAFGRQIDAGNMTLSGIKGASERKITRLVDRRVSDLKLGSVESPQTQVSHSKNELPWEIFRPELLDELIRDQHTVMVDFTADW